MLGKHFTTELHPQPQRIFLKGEKKRGIESVQGSGGKCFDDSVSVAPINAF
jgi:hypothetical protein